MKNAIIWLSIAFFSSMAQTTSAGDFELTLWGVSHHLEQAPARYNWNETNPGIGVRYYLRDMYGFETYLEADYITRNSTGGSLTQVGGGAHYPFHLTDNMSVLTGVAVGIARYENVWARKTGVGIGGFPYVGFRYQSTTLTFGYVPSVNNASIQTYEAVFSTLSYRF